MSSFFAMACTDDEKQTALNVAEVFCSLMDKQRDLLATYLADDAILDWFGRTISSKDSIAEFLKLEVPETVHSFISIEPSGPIQHRKKALMTVDDENIVKPSKGQELLDNSLSDEDLAKPLDNSSYVVDASCSKESDLTAQVGLSSLSLQSDITKKCNMLTSYHSQFTSPMNCGVPLASEVHRIVTQKECQGECHLKTSAKSVTTLNRFLEACGSIQFQHTRQSGMAPKNVRLKAGTVKWNRLCRLQIAYNINPNVWFHGNDCGEIFGEFKIWLLVYQDYTRCRRNLSAAFDQVK